MKTGIQKIIAQFKEIASGSNIKLDIENTPVKPVKRLLRLFNEIEDTRSEPRVTYPLGELLLIAFIAILSSADSFVLIETFCNRKIELLRKFTPLSNGVPSHDTFRRVFTLLDPECLQNATVDYLLDNIKLMRRAFGIDEEGLRHLCVDGKTARGSGRLAGTPDEIPDLHTLHVYDSTNGICLVSKPVGEGTNEIPVAQQVLKCLDLKNVIVTFDAMHTQRETVQIIVRQKGHYLGSLKGNQPDLLEEVASYFSAARLRRIKDSKSNFLTYTEKARNCVETRTFWFTKNVDWLVQLDEWHGIKSIVRYEKKSENIKSGKQTKEEHYYVSSLTNIHDCADAIREHWSIENNLHWHLDATLREDDCLISDRKAFQNFSLMQKLVLSLLKLAAPVYKVSVKSARHLAAWGTEDILRVLCAFDEDALKDAMLKVDSQAGRKGKTKIPEDY